jgi:uncharacterized delta-60 repeat protein
MYPMHVAAPALSRRQIPIARGRIAAAVLALFATPCALALDPGEDGLHVTIPITALDDTAYAVAIDPAGNLVIAGTDAGARSILASITRTGALDGAFGIDGVAINDLTPTQGDALRAIVRMPDGRYVGCGQLFNTAGSATDFDAARFMSDGSLDTTFDGVGYVVTPFALTGAGGLLYDQCNTVAVQGDGSVVSAGYTSEAGPPHVGVMRHTLSGQLDTNFGSGGILDINAGATSNGSSEARAVLVQPDGKILIAGYATGQFNDEFLVLRLNADGTPDGGFGSFGIVRTPIGTGEDIANAMVLQPDGRIVLAGSAVAADGRRDFALVRYMGDGALDASFGTGGIVTTPIGPGDDIARSLTLMPWGRLVAGGTARISTSAGGSDFALVAYNADGTLDGYFGDLGIRTVNVSTSTTAEDIAYGLATDIEGEHLWAVGTATPLTNVDFVAVEIGLPDTLFRHGFDTNTAP